jgi:hypothetical protein
MASKLNPKGIFKSNLKSKSPNPKGINPKGIFNAPTKPRVNPDKINPKGIGPNKGGINPGGIKKYSLGEIQKLAQAKSPVVKGKTTPAKINVKSSNKKVDSKALIKTANQSKGFPKIDFGNTIKKGKVSKNLKGALIATGAILAGEAISKYVSKSDNKKNVKNSTSSKDKESTKKDTTKTSEAKKSNQASYKSTSIKNIRKNYGNKVPMDPYKRDAWGRVPSDKWYNFDPKTKKYINPKDTSKDTVKKDAVKNTENKKSTVPVKPKTTAPVATPAVIAKEEVGTLPLKSASMPSVEASKTIIGPKPSTPSPATPVASAPSTPKMQPKSGIINKIRGAVNEVRDRRADKLEERGNEGRAQRLRGKISETEKKMMMKKGGVTKVKRK